MDNSEHEEAAVAVWELLLGLGGFLKFIERRWGESLAYELMADITADGMDPQSSDLEIATRAWLVVFHLSRRIQVKIDVPKSTGEFFEFLKVAVQRRLASDGESAQPAADGEFV